MTRSVKYEVGRENHMRGKGSLLLAGERFGRLTAIRDVGRKHRSVLWECICDCGVIVEVVSSNLRRGSTKSCGCLALDVSSEVHTKHGHASVKTGVSRAYHVWRGMLRRCWDSRVPAYPLYGGRGISVCVRWLEFKNFIADMGNPPPGMSIDRLDNNGNYEPSNCAWSTAAQQSRNQRRNVVITWNNKTQCLKDWSTELGVPYNTIRNRMLRGKPIDDLMNGRRR